MAKLPQSPRILSVQSHVVSGYCGNKSATFPLQLLGFEVDVVNTVQYSNHTQYKVTRGQIFTGRDLDELHAGLDANHLTNLYDFILSGYVADIGYLESLAKLASNIKRARKKLRLDCWYTLDPVLGDDGVGFYVPKGAEVAKTYTEHLLPLADILVPNRFEASVLSGVDIDSSSHNVLHQALEAIEFFHKTMKISIVALTSLEIASEPDKLTCIVSYDPSARGPDNIRAAIGPAQVWSLKIPKLELHFTGTGDLFSALFTGWLFESNFNVKESLENTSNSIHDILIDTLNWYRQTPDKSCQSYELRLVQNRDKIIKPSKVLFAEKLNVDPSLSKKLN